MRCSGIFITINNIAAKISNLTDNFAKSTSSRKNLKEPDSKNDSGNAMGRRKSKRGPPPRARREPLDTLFNCPFCNHEKSCEVKMEKSKNTGNIKCVVCMEDFQGCKQFVLTTF